MSEIALERLRNFRFERINKIVSEDTPISVDVYPKTVIHIVPLSMCDPSVKFNLAQFGQQSEKLRAIKTKGQSFRYNFDGIVPYSIGRKAREYAQVFTMVLLKPLGRKV
ncbi:MAG: hypothetical protein WAM14_20835 [Candidatus Nitrosopolaris sp.]